MSKYKIAAVYKFVTLADFEALRQPLIDFCVCHDIKGTLLLADEGINGTVAGSSSSIDAFTAYLKTDPLFGARFEDIDLKYSFSDKAPFLRMKVRLKQEIVTLRAVEANPAIKAGTYVSSDKWNEIISDPDMTIIDTRNDYEVEIGTFPGALDPEMSSFTDFKDWVAANLDPQKNKKVAMFCTGGIRCEKASSYMLAHGFDEVYHLQGGILRYLETQPAEKSMWRGGCFVFDERVAVGADLAPLDYLLCHSCRHPLSPADREDPDYELGVQCKYCVNERSDKERSRARERQKQMRLAEEAGIAHLGDQASVDAARQAEIKKRSREVSRQLSLSENAKKS